jgi:hypothetical protein
MPLNFDSTMPSHGVLLLCKPWLYKYIFPDLWTNSFWISWIGRSRAHTFAAPPLSAIKYNPAKEIWEIFLFTEDSQTTFLYNKETRAGDIFFKFFTQDFFHGSTLYGAQILRLNGFWFPIVGYIIDSNLCRSLQHLFCIRIVAYTIDSKTIAQIQISKSESLLPCRSRL